MTGYLVDCYYMPVFVILFLVFKGMRKIVSAAVVVVDQLEDQLEGWG